MSVIASQITGPSNVCSATCLGHIHSQHTSSALLTPLWGKPAGDLWFPHTKDQLNGNRFPVMIMETMNA